MNQSVSETAVAPGDVHADSGVDVDVDVDVDAVNAMVAKLREEIDEIDAELISIVQRRVAVSKQIQAVRMSHGGPRRQHSRELKIVNAYVDGLGRGGSQLALTVLELSRGRA
jgi:chorismate mutase